MKRMKRSGLQCVLKLMNSVIGLLGMGMILYALWMIRQWYKFAIFYGNGNGNESSPPWFIYTFLVLGTLLCLITCSGHIAAETANAHCLSFDFPLDPTGKFEELMKFVRTNSEMCKWIGLTLVLTQIISILLAMALRTLGPDLVIDYESDDDVIPAWLPLLRNQSQHGPYLSVSSSPKNES